MVDFISQRVIARLAGLLFIASSLLILPGILLEETGASASAAEAGDASGLLVVVAGGVVIGLVTLLLPWHRWPRRASLVLVPVALVLIAVGNVIKPDPWTYPIYFVVVFVWLGVGHPRWASTKFAPLATVAYLIPDVWTELPSAAYEAAVVVMPTCVLVGESLAWVSARLRRAEDNDRRRMRDMHSLLQATVQLAHQNDPVEAANLTAEVAVRLLDGTSAIVLLLDASGAVRGAGAHAWPGPPDIVYSRWLDKPARDALRTGAIVHHAGSASAGHLTSAARGAPVVFLPLVGTSEPLGLVMVTFDAEDSTTDIDAFTSGLARTFATQASLSFERLQATRQLVDASLRDPLTGIGNRREADAALRRVRPGDAVCLIDLDHFKDVNDTYGHATGDQVLAGLAAFLQQRLRDGDTVARYGGEEFLVIMRGSGAGARLAVERISEEWQATEPITTFSAGLAVHDDAISQPATLALADGALYGAKQAGRNRVFLTGLADADAADEAGAAGPGDAAATAGDAEAPIILSPPSHSPT